MRTRICIALALLLTWLAPAGLAEGAPAARIILTGKVEAKRTETVCAPFGGTVRDFSLRPGDRVREGGLLLTLDAQTLYAPCDGTVRGIFAQAGDSAAHVQSRYGALCYIEPAAAMRVEASLSQAYDTPENRLLHHGETVYLRGQAAGRHGVGRVVSLQGDAYTVEILSGGLQLRDSVTLHRDAAYTTLTRIGQGTVARAAPVAVTGDGAVLTILARDGAAVARGEALFTMAAGQLDEMAPKDARVRAPRDGIVGTVPVSAGQAVSKGQPLVTLYRLDEFQLVSAVGELDVGEITPGDTVRITLDGLPGAEYEGVIASISGVGQVHDSYTEYKVYIDFVPDGAVLLGMSGTAYGGEP